MRHFALCCLLALAACGGSEKAPDASGGGSSATVPPKAAKAAALAKELEASPDDAVAILEKHGLTRQQFEDLMYEIASDEELSKAYTRARGR